MSRLFKVFLLIVSTSFDCLVVCIRPTVLENNKEELGNLAKQIQYDAAGVLTINGNISGTTDTIYIDRKPLPLECNRRPYYVLHICPLSIDKMIYEGEMCSEGITFCYDSQLVEGRAREFYVLHRIDKDPLSSKCMDFKGFKIAFKYLKNSDHEKNNNTFMEITTSFTNEPYFFPLPNSKCLNLYLGNSKDVLTGVRVNKDDEKPVQPVEVISDDKTTAMGVHYKNKEYFLNEFLTLPDTKNLQYYSDDPHLKMLYLDVRARIFSPQMMMAVIPDNCNMLIQVQSNMVESCVSNFKQKNFALHALNNSQTATTYTLSIETGTDDWRTTGIKKGSSKSSSKSTETGQSTIEETSDQQGSQSGSETITTETGIDTVTDSQGKELRLDGGAKLEGGIKKGNFEAGGELGGGGGFTDSSGTTDTKTKIDILQNIRRHSETTITSRSTILETAFKETSTAIETEKKQTFRSTTVGVLKRTIFKWIVKVPPGKVVIPMQMQMDCDGATVKIPRIKFMIKKEGEDFSSIDYDGGSEPNLDDFPQ